MLQDGGGLIKAVHGHTHTLSAVPADDLLQSPEEVAAAFNGTCKRLGPVAAAGVYFRAGGVALGLAALGIFAFTQTTRIMGDWWIRCGGGGAASPDALRTPC
jgi:hypothetical protein